MVPLDEALEYVESLATPLNTIEVPLDGTLGLVLASDVVAAELLPSFDNSAVDGFAVRSADPNEGLEVVGTQFAGVRQPLEVGEGQAVRIMTGAPLPAGADAVVMVENTEVTSAGPGRERLSFQGGAVAGQFIRRAGEDVAPGQLVLTAGTRITAAVLGVLASLNHRNVTVVRPPRVGVFSTGDELVSDGGPLGDGQIRDSNRPTLLAAVRSMGFEAVDLGCIADEAQAIEDALRLGAGSCDVLVTSGGVSMGDADLIKAVLAEIAEMRWMQVSIKPAKPLAAGLLDGTPVLGLPGNPVSALVSFELFARRVIERRAGIESDPVVWFEAVFPEGAARRPDGKTHFPRVVVETSDRGAVARLARAQGSHQMAATATANGLARIDDGQGVEPGGTALVRIFPR